MHQCRLFIPKSESVVILPPYQSTKPSSNHFLCYDLHTYCEAVSERLLCVWVMHLLNRYTSIGYLSSTDSSRTQDAMPLTLWVTFSDLLHHNDMLRPSLLWWKKLITIFQTRFFNTSFSSSVFPSWTICSNEAQKKTLPRPYEDDVFHTCN